MTDTFDTPPDNEVLQEDITESEPIVDVRVANVIRTDEMPTILSGAGWHHIVTGARAVKVAQANPRRKQIIFWAIAIAGGCEVICVAPTEAECNAFRGALLWPGTGLLRYKFTFQDELWARGADLQSTSGDLTGIAVSTDDGILNYIEEDWAH